MSHPETPLAASLPGGVSMRIVREADAGPLADAYRRNGAHLAPWEPVRSAEFLTAAGQHANIVAKLGMFDAGTGVPWVLVCGGRAVGTLTLSGIVRGPFLSANLGYWVDQEVNGRGICTAAVGHVLDAARSTLGLHRIQAATLLHNAASQKVLRRAGFQEIGTAPQYLKIAGSWQDHLLFQRLLY